MLYTFIWKSSVNRVKKDIMQEKYQEGGLKMIYTFFYFGFEVHMDQETLFQQL